eukprot:31074-Pelagococcus_subviridis.AAC.28
MKGLPIASSPRGLSSQPADRASCFVSVAEPPRVQRRERERSTRAHSLAPRAGLVRSLRERIRPRPRATAAFAARRAKEGARADLGRILEVATREVPGKKTKSARRDAISPPCSRTRRR